jgi:tRNA(adenine34) deaminase
MSLSQQQFHSLMGRALEVAARGASAGEVPVGAVVVDLATGEEIAACHNLVEQQGAVTSHAEVLALQQAGARRGGWRLDGCGLFVTLEPCTMCIGAIRLARLDLLVYGAADPRLGACGSLYDLSLDERLGPPPRVVLQRFFSARRKR